MGIFDSLYTGASGLNAAQLQIQVTGHNITNLNSDYYSRQRVVQSAATPTHTSYGDIGMGTKVDKIIRIHDEFVFNKLKSALSNKENTGYKQQVLQEIASRFPDLKDTGLLRDIQNYFDAWNNFASHPYEASQKANLLNITNTLTNRINDTSNQLKNLHSNINEHINLAVDEINRLGKQISELNVQIYKVETGVGQSANDLRDKRDKLEMTMANLANITTFESGAKLNSQFNTIDSSKSYNLNIDGISIVDGVNFHPLVLGENSSKDGFKTVFYELNDGTRIDMSAKIHGGKLGAMLDMRGRKVDKNGDFLDGEITQIKDNLDIFTKTFIEQTNNIYATASQESMSSDDLADMRANTTLQNYDKSIQNGSFDVIVYNTKGEEVARKTISINSSTTMDDTTQGNSVVSEFNSNTDDNSDGNLNNDVDDYFSAKFSYDNNAKLGHLSFSPKSSAGEYFIAIEDKGTNFPGVFAMSRFFEGNSASNIKVDTAITNDSSRIKGGKTPVEGDNSMANEIINLQNVKLNFYGKNGNATNETLSGYYRFLTTDIASKTESINALHSTNTSLFKSVNEQFQSSSGVNMDEELSALIRFQSSYGAAAKIISTVEKMLDTLLSVK